MTASTTAYVPHSTKPTTRACGNAACSPLFTPGRPKNTALSAVSATSRQVPSIATNRRPANHAPGAPRTANGAATHSNNARTGPNPNRARAWKIADFDGNFIASASDTHDKPSVNNDNTSSYEPPECNAIPIAKYAITRAATTDAAAQSGHTRRSLHPPHPAGIPASTPGPV